MPSCISKRNRSRRTAQKLPLIDYGRDDQTLGGNLLAKLFNLNSKLSKNGYANFRGHPKSRHAKEKGRIQNPENDFLSHKLL